MKHSSIYIIAERRKGCITQETYELHGFALAVHGSKNPVFLVPGKDTEEDAREISQKTGCDVVALTGDHLEHYNVLSHAYALLEILDKQTEAWICLPHSSMGYDLAPRLAVLLKAACVTAVESVSGGSLSRPTCSGRFRQDVTPKTSRVVVTVLPGSFGPCLEKPDSAGSVKVIEVPRREELSQTLGTFESLHMDSSLKDADVVVCAGRGIGEKENLSLIKRLAAFFPRSAIGASRSVCDLGWLEHKHQIGTTGQSVSPRLYIACGISGAFQHVSGIKGAQTIVAINTDPHAAIFRVAHYCIVEDLTTFIPILLDALSADDK